MADMIMALAAVFLGGAFAFAGWGWEMRGRRLKLLFRSLTVECVLAALWLLVWQWEWSHQLLVVFILVAIAIPSFFFWEMIPFPIWQLFRNDGIITIRLITKSRLYEPISNRWDMKYRPEDFVFPYILGLNVSPILNGLNYLSLTGYVVNTLPCHFELNKVRVQLFLTELYSAPQQPNQISSKEQPIVEEEPMTKRLKVRKSLVLWAECTNELPNFRIYLTKKARDGVIRCYYQNKAVQVCLKIHYEKNKELSTRAINMALLNGGELYHA